MRDAQILTSAILATAVLLLALEPAHATVTPISRDTELYVSGGCSTGDPNCDPASGIGYSTDSYTGLGSYSNSITYFGQATASQQSSISTTGPTTDISVQTSAYGTVFAGAAHSLLTLTFSLSAPEQFTFTAQSTFFTQPAGGTATLKIQEPSGAVIIPQTTSYQIFIDGEEVSSEATGVLNAPGPYTLYVEASAATISGEDEAVENDADLKLEPVPLPDSFGLALPAFVLLGVISYRRRSWSSAPVATVLRA